MNDRTEALLRIGADAIMLTGVTGIAGAVGIVAGLVKRDTPMALLGLCTAGLSALVLRRISPVP